ncbi:MAG: hypothetical protein HY759_01645 [Nitrospirae bacterium]|nr:hypothetical protein [Nitrospirota bacterium]
MFCLTKRRNNSTLDSLRSCRRESKFIAVVFIFLIIIPLSYAEEKRYPVPLEDSPVYGPPDAPVTMIEFLDFQ